jgi:GT2 family glycosyltransferase
MTVALVVLNWNGKELLKRFLPEMLRYSKEATIYVIDNDSTDDSIDFLSTEFPEVNPIINTENLGYAGGYNAGLKGIKEELICLINNDIRVTKNWLPPIINFFKNNSNTGIVQPHILDEKDPSLFEYAGAAGGYIDRFGYPFCRGRIFDQIEQDQGQYEGNQNIFWASGACLFIRNALFQKLDGFDEDFFMHQDEIDLCWRANNAGSEVYCVGDSKVYHLGGASLPDSPLKVFYNYRNATYMLLKNVPTVELPFILCSRLLLDGVAGVRFLVKGELRNCLSILKAHAHLYYNFFKMLRKRSGKKPKNSYYKLNSVVFQYFILKKSKFLNLRFSKS